VPEGLQRPLIRMSAFDCSHGWESVRLSFLVNRPKAEPGFRLERQTRRALRNTTSSYAADRPEGHRYTQSYSHFPPESSSSAPHVLLRRAQAAAEPFDNHLRTRRLRDSWPKAGGQDRSAQGVQ
jgi:hypothetical protein